MFIQIKLITVIETYDKSFWNPSKILCFNQYQDIIDGFITMVNSPALSFSKNRSISINYIHIVVKI